MKYTSRNPNGINQITGSAVAVTVLNNDVAVFTTSSLELDGALTASSAIISGNVTVLGTASINTLIVNQTKYSSGSNQLGDAADDVQTLFGTVRIPTGSLNVTGSTIISSSAATQLQVGSNLLFVSSSGFVGIGTTSSPSVGGTVKLYVEGTGSGVNGRTYFIVKNTNSTSAAAFSLINSSGKILGAQINGSGWPTGESGGFNTEYGLNMTFVTDGHVASGGTSTISFLAGGYSVVPTITIVPGNPGNVLIGTTTDGARLRVKGSGTTSATTALRVENANLSSSLVVLDNGYVGIGTATPTYKLQVVDTDNLNPVFEAINNANSSTYIPVFEVNAPNLTSGKTSYFAIGRNRANNNQFSFGFEYDSNGSTNNKFNINAYGTPILFTVLASGNVGIGATTPAFKLDVSGSGRFTNNLTVTGSLTVITGSAIEFQVNQTGVKIGNAPTDSHQITGSVAISSSAGTGSALTVYKSGSTVVSIQGSQGELFSITDSLSGSLFSVSNISGLPILEVFSDNTVLLGSYLDPMLITTQRLTANSGSTVIYSLPTASYDGVFVDYTIRSGSNARAGQIMGMWSGSTATYTDNSTTDFGSTAGFNFGLIVSGSNMVLTGSASTSGWTVRAGIRSI
jgi:hypothetical protein